MSANDQQLVPSTSAASQTPTSTPASSRASTPSHPRPDKTRFTPKQREWIGHAIFHVLRETNQPLDGRIDQEICDRVCDVLQELPLRVRFQRRPPIKTIRGILKSMLDPAELINKPSKAGRPKINIESDIQAELAIDPNSTSRSLSLKLPASQSTIARRLKSSKELDLFFYRNSRVQILDQKAIDFRALFADKMHEWIMTRKCINRRSFNYLDIMFTDECMIGLTPRHNRRNDGMHLARDDPRREQLIHEERAFDSGIHIWIGLHAIAGIIGPYFIDEIPVPARLSHSLNSARYIWLLENRIIPDLKAKLTEAEFERCWFQQDGASAHKANDSLEVLVHHFGQRIISRRTQTEWPPHSPDLTPCDYSFWNELRSIVTAEHNPQTLPDVKKAVIESCSSIPLDKIIKMISDFPIRILACKEKNGAHFDPWLKQFKTRVNNTEPCEDCAVAHYCRCWTCNRFCKERAARIAEEEMASSTSTVEAFETGEDQEWELLPDWDIDID